MHTGRLFTALEYFNSVPRDGSQVAVLAAFSAAELYRTTGRLSDAEREYADVLVHEPINAQAHERMAFLLGATGRRWESLPHFMFLLRSRTADIEQLVLLADLERPMEQGEFLKRCVAQSSNDVLVKLGLAADALAEGRSVAAREELREVVRQAPQLIAGQALLGELLVDADDATFVEWNSRLTPEAEEYPDTWFVRGLWARRQGNLRVAAACFWHTVKLAPVHRRGTYQLGQILNALGETSGSDFADRSAKLFELSQLLDEVLRSKGENERAMQRVTELMEDMGRVWEACAWAGMSTRKFPEAHWPSSTLRRLEGLLHDDLPQTLDSTNLSLRFDLSGFPNYEEMLRRIVPANAPGPSASLGSSIHFAEAQMAGIEFTYFNGADLSTKGARMFEQTGGGVAVIDFDSDGWPDLFFTQGAPWPQGANEPLVDDQLTDRLYHNRRGRSFADVTHVAALVDGGFGQGCSVGDFDNDGFPDLYVANIGHNQLHHNNGDGTFTDVTNGSGLGDDAWTSSCVIVDLNADGFPDIFDITYVTGDRVYEAICKGRACSPKVFDGTPDRLYLSRGDGTFEFVPHAVPESNSKGLGVVAMDVEIRGRPSLFIANDQVPNFFLRNTPSDDRFNVRLEDEGFASGLAFNEDGLAMAGMGIAADDVNGDGRIDFYVSTFKDEPKVLYLQDAPGLFVDATNAAGLRAAGYAFVGWGAQFLDADCDGEPDLVTANGHVDDYRDEGGEYQMRPQFFRNTGAGRFVELMAAEAGSYFGKKALGRGVARLDWNRDGQMDFVVSNIGSRAALVTNTTTGFGSFLNVRLHSLATARDAIGSVVEVVTQRRRWSKQLMAGDGYMASNERLLQFGLGDAEGVTELRINWPSGELTIIRDLPVNVTVEIVDGNPPRGILWRDAEPAMLVVAPPP